MPMADRRAEQGDEVPCPIGLAAPVIGDRWALLIMRNAMGGMTRFQEFRDALGIADNVLSTRMSRLVEAGLLVRTPYRDGGRTRQEYRLTTAGADLLPVLNALVAWSNKHIEGVNRDDPMKVLHSVCGQPLGPGEFCPACERRAERDEIRWLRPWASREPFPVAEPVASPAAS